MRSRLPLSLKRLADASQRAAMLGKEIWLSDDVGFRGPGRLVARVTGASIRLYFRWTTADARRIHEPIGPFSRFAKIGYLTLEQGRTRATLLSAQRLAGLPVKAVERAAGPAADEHEAATPDPGAAGVVTVWHLCEHYVRVLKYEEKASADDVAGTLRRYVQNSELAKTPAHLASTEQFTDLIRPIVEASHRNTARLLRSHLHAAYQTAMTVSKNPNQPKVEGATLLKRNPVADMVKVKGARGTRNRALSSRELQALLSHLSTFESLNTAPGVAARVCRLMLYLGGQRGKQLLSCKTSALDLTRTPVPTLTLEDPKGRTDDVPRIHVLPVEGLVLEELKWFQARSREMQSRWLFCAMNPNKPMRQNDMSDVIRRLARVMQEVPEVTPSHFQYSDLRRTVETLMVPLGIGEDTRGRLLSHGLANVQNTHYNRFDYIDFKREGLRRWHAFLMKLEGRTDLPETSRELLP